VKKAFPALLVALAGAGIAFAMVVSDVKWGLAVLIPMALGWLAEFKAKSQTLADPVGSLIWYRWTLLKPYGLAILVSTVLIGLAVWLVPPEKPTVTPGVTPPTPTPAATTFDKYWPEILKVIAGALSAFFTAAFLKSMDDPDEWVADMTRSEFQRRFVVKKFDPNSPAGLALRSEEFQGAGWDADGRFKRATAIAAG
jgi:hypothetical protein